MVILLNIMLKIPICNIITCEDIRVNSDNRMFISGPFTCMSRKCTRRFYTYTVLQGIPNGFLTFKIEIAGPDGRIIKSTEENTSIVEENLLLVKTRWLNIRFNEHGEHTVRVLVKCNNEFDIIGSSNIHIT